MTNPEPLPLPNPNLNPPQPEPTILGKHAEIVKALIDRANEISEFKIPDEIASAALKGDAVDINLLLNNFSNTIVAKKGKDQEYLKGLTNASRRQQHESTRTTIASSFGLDPSELVGKDGNALDYPEIFAIVKSKQSLRIKEAEMKSLDGNTAAKFMEKDNEINAANLRAAEAIDKLGKVETHYDGVIKQQRINYEFERALLSIAATGKFTGSTELIKTGLANIVFTQFDIKENNGSLTIMRKVTEKPHKDLVEAIEVIMKENPAMFEGFINKSNGHVTDTGKDRKVPIPVPANTVPVRKLNSLAEQKYKEAGIS